jgi:hypothetical protein
MFPNISNLRLIVLLLLAMSAYRCSVTKTAVVSDGTTRVPV